MPYALKTIKADGTTRNGFKWPDFGEVIEERNIQHENTSSCPITAGDGICLGKTFYGMSWGGIPAHIILSVRYKQQDVLGEDREKLRVCRAVVVKKYTILEWIKNHPKADLRGADLREADLHGADLGWADLRKADLGWADLREADLRWADLGWTDLRWVDLREADLRWTDLRWTDLRGADLRGANLRGAKGVETYRKRIEKYLA